MFDKSIIKLFVKLIGGLAGVGIMLFIMTNATSRPNEVETDNLIILLSNIFISPHE